MTFLSPLLFPNSGLPPPTSSAGWGWQGGGDTAPAPASSGGAPTPAASPAGYAEPLKGVPPEKFNHTAIPKGYRCPWQEFISYRDYQSDGRSYTPSLRDYRNFNK